jgi:hypothetical protein
MIFIAHRALYKGPDPEKENSVAQIEKAINAGFDCEIDVRLIDDKWFLGHDRPDYEVSVDFFEDHSDKLWIHCKNLEALDGMNDKNCSLNAARQLHFFWHQEDDFSLTSEKYIWSYPGKPVASEGGILVLPEIDPLWQTKELPECYGICSKFVAEIKSKHWLTTI